MFNLKETYKPLFESNTRYYNVTGGRGSGKSYSITAFLLLLTYEKEQVILFTRYTLKSASISIIPEFLSKIDEANLTSHFIITKDKIINKLSGSSIIFSGIKTSAGNQTANLKSISGVTCWVLDEAEELTDEDIFDKIDLSIRVKNKVNRIICILNPTTKEHFIYKKFYEANGIDDYSNVIKNDITFIHTSYLDNIDNLSKSFIDNARKLALTNPDKYNHIMLGGWLNKAEGIIFNNWTIGNFDNNLPYGYGMDFGFFPDPTTLIKVAVDKKTKTIYLSQELYKTDLVTSDIIKECKSTCGIKEIIADSAEKRLIEEIKKSGLNVKACKKGAGSVEEGIKLMLDYSIVVSPESIDLIKEFNNYTWSNKKAGQPIDAYNHCIDAARYRISHILKQYNNGSIK